MAAGEMSEVCRQQAPPLPGGNRRAVISEQIRGSAAEKPQPQHERRDSEERNTVAPAAVDRLQPDPKFQRFRARGRIKPANPRRPVSRSGKDGGSGTGERLSVPV